MSNFAEYINRLRDTYDRMFVVVADYPVDRRDCEEHTRQLEEFIA